MNKIFLQFVPFIVFIIIAYVFQINNRINPKDFSRILITEASFGLNCGASKNNVYPWISSACDHKSSCIYRFDWGLLGNPNNKCIKSFEITWLCNGLIKNKKIDIEPKQFEIVEISCSK